MIVNTIATSIAFLSHIHTYRNIVHYNLLLVRGGILSAPKYISQGVNFCITIPILQYTKHHIPYRYKTHLKKEKLIENSQFQFQHKRTTIEHFPRKETTYEDGTPSK